MVIIFLHYLRREDDHVEYYSVATIFIQQIPCSEHQNITVVKFS